MSKFSTGILKKPYDCPECKSKVMILSAPTTSISFDISAQDIGTLIVEHSKNYRLQFIFALNIFKKYISLFLKLD